MAAEPGSDPFLFRALGYRRPSSRARQTLTKGVQTDFGGNHRCLRHSRSVCDGGQSSVRTSTPEGPVQDDMIKRRAADECHLSGAMDFPTRGHQHVQRAKVSVSEGTPARQGRRSALPAVNFSRWSRSKKPSQLVQLTEKYLASLYQPFSSVRKQLVQQARDVLLGRCNGNYEVFEEQFLKGTAELLRKLQKSTTETGWCWLVFKEVQFSKRKKKQAGWPLCSHGYIIIHLLPFDDQLLKPGDFYLSVNDVGSLTLKYCDNEGFVDQRTFNESEFGFFFASLMEQQSLRTTTDADQLTKILSHLMVSVERGIERIQTENLAKDFLKESSQSCRRRTRNRTVCTRDSWVQTTFPLNDESNSNSSHAETTDTVGLKSEPQVQSLAPLASEEEFLSDTESKFKRNNERLAEDADHSPKNDLDGNVDKTSCTPTSITQLDQSLLESRVALLTGSRDICGRSVIFISLRRLKAPCSASAFQLAQQLLYFEIIPKKDTLCQGFLVIIDSRDASNKEWNIFLESLSLAQASAPNSFKLCLVWPKVEKNGFLPQDQFDASNIQFEVIANEKELLSYIRKNQLLPDFGGTYVYDHEEWTSFHKLLDPFIDGCRNTGEYLVRVMQELRGSHVPSSTSLTNQMIEQQKKQIIAALEDEQLRHLEDEGEVVIKQLEAYCKKSPHNIGYKEAIETSTLLYKQLKKVLQRLTKLADKQLSKLQECMMLKSYEEESTQVLSWLCLKGEETLKKHKTLAESFNAIKQQENEFEKFYFLAMRQIERGNDLLEEVPKSKEVMVSEVDGITSVLKNQLNDFAERLEVARERLEDSSRCYHLLDKCYEWALETMRFVSHMKIDSSTSFDEALKIIEHLEDYLSQHPPINDSVFEEMIQLATKLQNDRLLQQCQTAKTKCQETVDLIQARRETLEKAKDNLEDEALNTSNTQTRSHVWMPVISSTPYRTSSQSFLHERASSFSSQIFREPTGSYTSFPSSYYPATELKNNRLLEHYNRKNKEHFMRNGLITKDMRNQRPVASLLSSLIDTVNSKPDGRRRSYASSSSSSSMRSSTQSRGSQETLFNMSSVSRGIPSGQSTRRQSQVQEKHEAWKVFDDILEKVTEEVREQNTRLQLEHVTERESDTEDLVCATSCNFVEHFPSSSSKPQRPVPVNAHLLRCTSCSDFEDLLSPKNSEGDPNKGKSKKILKMIMREMIQTERDYVKSLEYIIENYIPVLQKPDIPQVLRGQRNVLFGNIEKIYEFHNCYFLHELEQCESMPYSVGQCFLKYEPQFYLYALYNKNKPKSDALMAEYGSSFFRTKQQELGDKMDLSSYLLKPVQRMGKYALLLKQLLKECPERDNDYDELKAAEEMVCFQLRHGNDLLAMDALKECDVNVKEQGRLLRQDEFLVWQGKSRKALRHVFLFEDLVLFSKARRDPECKGHDYYQYKFSFKTSDIGLTEQVGESPTKFEIWFRKRKIQDVYTLQAPSAEIKQAWVQDISKLLWKQALRNRELRLAEMSSMGIGNKPCLDISPSQDQICDRSISLHQLNKAPRFRNSIAVSTANCDNFQGNRRPYSIISVSSSASSGSSQSSSTFHSPLNNLLEANENQVSQCQSVAHRSQCSAESGFFTDVSMSGDSYAESDYQHVKMVERSNSILSQVSFTSSVGAVCSEGTDVKIEEQVESSSSS